MPELSVPLNYKLSIQKVAHSDVLCALWIKDRQWIKFSIFIWRLKKSQDYVYGRIEYKVTWITWRKQHVTWDVKIRLEYITKSDQKIYQGSHIETDFIIQVGNLKHLLLSCINNYNISKNSVWNWFSFYVFPVFLQVGNGFVPNGLERMDTPPTVCISRYQWIWIKDTRGFWWTLHQVSKR